MGTMASLPSRLIPYPTAFDAPADSALRFREVNPPVPPRPRLLDRVREAIRTRHYSRRTEKAYVDWINRYIFFHGKRHPMEMGAGEVTTFLTALAVQGKVAASTQNQALSALLFLYRAVLGVQLPWLDGLVRARPPQHLPVVLTREEVRTVLSRLDGVPRLMAIILYGAGLRLLECCRLRIQDVDFARNQIVVRDGKGNKDRVTMLPAAVKTSLIAHVKRVREQHEADLRHGAGWVELAAAPSARVGPAARCHDRRAVHGHRQTGDLSHLAALVRDSPAGGWLRYPDRPGVAGTSRRRHDHDLHARPQPWPRCCPKSRRPDVPLMTGSPECVSTTVLDCAIMPSHTTPASFRLRNPPKDQRPPTPPALLARLATPYNAVPAISRQIASYAMGG
jgi:integrase